MRKREKDIGGNVRYMKNILFLSAGRRVELLRFARETLNKKDIPAQIFACDMSPTAPALFFADKQFIVPPINDVSYVEEIIKISRENKVDVIIPTIDTELLPLAERYGEITERTGALVNLSSEWTVSICRDKVRTAKFLQENGFGCPLLYEPEEVVFPAFIKPKHGSSSISANKINTQREMDFYLSIIPEPIIQEYIQGEEYTVDTFSDYDSNPVTIVPRKRLSVRSGEIMKGYIAKDREIIKQCKRLIKVLKLCGHNTVQCIKANNKICFIEINARFGGGAPMSLRAGADSIMNLVKLSDGETLAYSEEWLSDIFCSRFDDSIFFNDNGERLDL